MVAAHSAAAANAEAERKMSKYQKLEKIGEGTYGQPTHRTQRRLHSCQHPRCLQVVMSPVPPASPAPPTS